MTTLYTLIQIMCQIFNVTLAQSCSDWHFFISWSQETLCWELGTSCSNFISI